MNRKGFTLIELLIVVAIIGILAAVGVAVIPGLLENTKKNVVIQNCNQISKNVEIIYTDLEINGFVYLDDGSSPYSNCKPTRRVGNEFSGDIGGKLFHIHFNCNGIKNPINGDPGVRYNDRLSDPCSSWDVGKIAITTQNSWPDIWTGIACCSAEGEARIYNIDQR